MITTKPSYTLCEACRRPLRKGEQQRLINGYSIHVMDECFDLYVTKVEKGIIRLNYIAAHRSK